MPHGRKRCAAGKASSRGGGLWWGVRVAGFMQRSGGGTPPPTRFPAWLVEPLGIREVGGGSDNFLAAIAHPETWHEPGTPLPPLPDLIPNTIYSEPCTKHKPTRNTCLKLGVSLILNCPLNLTRVYATFAPRGWAECLFPCMGACQGCAGRLCWILSSYDIFVPCSKV